MSTPRPPAADLDWLASILWGAAEALTVNFGGPAPASHRAVESYRVMPAARAPRLLLPAGSKLGAAAAVGMYGSLRPPRDRLTRALLAAAVRSGLAPMLLRDRIDVWVRTGVPDSDLPTLVLTEHLRHAVFPNRDVTFAIGLGPRGILRKPVLHAVSGEGHPLAHVKVGWDPLTRDAVEREGRALEAWEPVPAIGLAVPRLLHQGRWRDLELVVVSALPRGIRRFTGRASEALEAVRQTAELEGRREVTLGDSAYWRRLCTRLSVAVEAGPADVSEALAPVQTRVEERFADVTLPFGRWHGDFSPWNLGRVGERLFVWDWEQSTEDVPVGFDALHFGFQVAFVLRRKAVADALADSRAEGLPLLRALGLSDPAAEATASLYVLELFLRYLEAMVAGEPLPNRVYTGIVKVLRQETGWFSSR